MPVHNKEIAEIFNEIADLLEIHGENQFRVRSYRNAVRSVLNSSENISEMVQNGDDLSELPGIGSSIAGKIREIVETGELKQLLDLRKEIPGSLTDIMKLEQMGPQRTKLIYDELKITSIEELKQAALDGKIETIPKLGKKTQEKILQEIESFKETGGSMRLKWSDANDFVQPLVQYLTKELKDIMVAGSYRRRQETIGDIDILATSSDPEKAMEHFILYDETVEILARGKTKSSIRLRSGLQIDLRIVEKRSYGSALFYFTGSKAHNIAIRKLAIEKGFKVNEYGIFNGKKQIAGKTEEEVYHALGLQYVEPELREDQGEIEASLKNGLPKLITLEDIRGDLHSHTNATDGKYSLEEMAKAAETKGYEYFAVTDHSRRVTMANGLDERRLEEQIERIDKLNSGLKKIQILKSIEVDILEDGTLDLPDHILKKLDLVVCSVHYNRNLSEEKQTSRILKAMDNPYFNILGHPTGRLIGERAGYEVDMKKIMQKAKEEGCFLEINSNPERLDLDDHLARMAKNMKIKFSISTDSHAIGNLDYMAYGIAQARRGWVEKDDVINTRPLKELKELLKRK